MLQPPNGPTDVYRFRQWWLLLEAIPSSKQVYKRIGVGYFDRLAPDVFHFATRQAVQIV